MELRARTSLLTRRAAPWAVLAVVLVPATAGAATTGATAQAAKKRVKPPVVRTVSPSRLNVGETLTIRGRHFRAGRNKNTVVFKRDRGRAVFVKAAIGTRKLLRVEVPKRLESAMAMTSGQPVATRFRLRVLTARLGKRFTSGSLAPLIGPEVPPPPPGQPTEAPKPGAADGDCDGDGVLNGADADDDNDLLGDDVEQLYKLDSCKGDTDGDGVTDGYEYRSALDLNDDEHQEANTFLPYPGKRPYPNPLDAEDANLDFDGDSLTLLEEFKLWKLTVANGAPASLDALTYTDGQQYSIATRGTDGRRRPALAAAGYDKWGSFVAWAQASGYWTIQLPDEVGLRSLLDVDRSGSVDSGPRAGFPHDEAMPLDLDGDSWLSDDERDEDADGLTNYVEAHGPLSPQYWQGVYPREKPFRIAYAGTDLDDADSDGDGVRDGADDQDHDNVPNLMELSRKMATGRPFDNPKTPKDATVNALGDPLDAPYYGRVNPFNPCLPLTDSATCPRYIPIGEAWAPFDGRPWDPEGDDPNYLVRN